MGVRTKAHPRMRGEGAPGRDQIDPHAGSSPHARGGPHGVGLERVDVRLIPACAGRAVRCGPGPGWDGAHPRMRGEGNVDGEDFTNNRGSSPHARGGLGVQDGGALGDRLIPACAGRAVQSHRNTPPSTAHPRMRGEGAIQRMGETGIRGSSPHARGGQDRLQPRHPQRRLIPACAGRAGLPMADHRRCPAHPRMRGEGRSAGTTADKHSAAHPRMRGEGGLGKKVSVKTRGSSPHARGGLCGRSSSRPGTRLIPACAGRATSWR